jgi:M6 family metalloprotease-like protein
VASLSSSLDSCPKGFRWSQGNGQCLPATIRLLPLRSLKVSPPSSKPVHVLLDKRLDTYVPASAAKATSLQVDLGRRYTVTKVKLSYVNFSNLQVPVTIVDQAGKVIGTGSLLAKTRSTLKVDVLQRQVVAGVQKIPVGQQFQVLVPKASGDVRLSDVSFWGGSDPNESLPANATIAWGLAVVVDFPNSVLEEYTQEEKAIKNVADLRTVLDQMEGHWRWMTHDKHQVEWAVERINVNQDIAPNAYGNDWVQFRKELAAKLLERVRIKDYDSNSDGNLDFAWFVLASKSVQDGDQGYFFMVAGRSLHDGVDVFLDGQGDFAIRDNCIGCFNHEAAHTNSVDLWDLYGDFDNLGGVSIMSNPWGAQPGGFLAYELMKKGWIDVLCIVHGPTNVCLTPLEDKDSSLAYRAARIETDDPDEFFMLEYHKRPRSGWGSGWTMNADGVLITHILLTGSNAVGPLPLIRIEPADGDLPYDAWPSETDFWNGADQVWDGVLYDGTPIVSASAFARETETKICFTVDFYK